MVTAATMSVTSQTSPLPSYLYHLHPHESNEEGSVLECPGYCGRVPVHSAPNDSSPPELSAVSRWSACRACPYGQRNSGDSVCRECTQPLGTYDYCFLLLYSLVPLLVNVLCHAQWRRRRRKQRSSGSTPQSATSENLWSLLQMASAITECVLPAVLSLLAAEPRGSLRVYGCAKSGIHEWYPSLSNPVVDYARTLKCSHELVYPLYSLPFLTIGMNLACLALFRTLVCLAVAWRARRREEPVVQCFALPYYAALWTLPLLALVHSLLAGPLFYTFPYICVISALVLNAFHLSFERRRGVLEMFTAVFAPRTLLHHLPVLLVHSGLLGFGLFAVVHPARHPHQPLVGGWPLGVLMVLVLPVPTLFFILTTRLTAPLRLTRYPRPR